MESNINLSLNEERTEQEKVKKPKDQSHLSTWEVELHVMKQCPQRQDSVDDQLRDLIRFAHKAGLYDAADFIKGHLK